MTTRIPIGVCTFGCLHYSDEIEEIIEYRGDKMDVRLRGAQLPLTLNMDTSMCRYDDEQRGIAEWLDGSVTGYEQLTDIGFGSFGPM